MQPVAGTQILTKHVVQLERILEQVIARIETATQDERQALIICVANELGTKRTLTHEFDTSGLFKLTQDSLRDIGDSLVIKLLLSVILEAATERFISFMREETGDKLDKAA